MAGADRGRGPRAARPSGALTTIGAARPAGAPAGDELPVPVGAVLAGRYRLLEALGRGGMGVVYRARDTVLDADVAVKLLEPGVAGDADRAAAFRNEVRIARRVTHPRVCRLHDLVEADGHWLITMQYVDGESLADRLRRESALSVGHAVHILRDVAEGLAAAHAAGVVHRDLKPANVLLAAEDGRAVVADFGIAADARAGGPVDVAGTRGYMAPEQAAGHAVDARGDVHSFGVLAHRMLTGELPWSAATRVASTDVGAAASAPADAPPALLALIDECLAAAPADRPADGAALLARLSTPGALAAAARRPGEPRPDGEERGARPGAAGEPGDDVAVLDEDPSSATRTGPGDRGAVDRGAVDRGSDDPRMVDRGLADRGAVDRGAVDRGSVDPRMVDRGLSDRGAVDRGSEVGDGDRGAVDRGSEVGAGDRGAVDRGPGKPGSAEALAGDPGSVELRSVELGAPASVAGGRASSIGSATARSAPRGRRRVVALLGGGALAAMAVAGIGLAGGWRPWSASVAPAAPLEEIAIEVVLDASASAEDGVTRDGLARLIAEELDDAWGIRARPIGASEARRSGTARLAARLWIGPDRRLVVEASLDREETGQGEGWEPGEGGRARSTRVEGTGVRVVARDLAGWAARAAMQGPLHPWPEELARVCARSPESWRLWQRARRESRMQRWSQARELAERAIGIDPGFPLAHLELAWTYTGEDPALIRAQARSVELAAACETLGEDWRLAFEAIRVAAAGDQAAARAVVERLLALPGLPSRERLYFQTRWAFALWFAGDRAEGKPLLEWIAEEWPTDAAAPKLLAHVHLEGDGSTDAAEALRYARQAVAAAPHDVAVRADLARALLASGDRAGAEAEARRLDRAEPVEKQGALAGSENENSLVSLRLELGQWTEAERDARRLLLGPVTERTQGRAALAALDAMRGAFAASVDQMVEASRECREAGIETTGAVHMWKAAWLAYQSGSWDRAAALFRSLEGDTRRGRTDVLLPLVEAQRGPEGARAGHLARARDAALALPAGSRSRLVHEMLVAHAAGEWGRVMELDGALREAGVGGALVPTLMAADAQAGLGELEDAEARLVRLATHPRAWKEPIAAVKAWRRLGDVRERRGDRAGAADAYRELLSRWTRAPSGQEDVVAARAGLRRLGAR